MDQKIDKQNYIIYMDSYFYSQYGGLTWNNTIKCYIRYSIT